MIYFNPFILKQLKVTPIYLPILRLDDSLWFWGWGGWRVCPTQTCSTLRVSGGVSGKKKKVSVVPSSLAAARPAASSLPAGFYCSFLFFCYVSFHFISSHTHQWALRIQENDRFRKNMENTHNLVACTLAHNKWPMQSTLRCHDKTYEEKLNTVLESNSE